ncbi:MAG: hypothetical protein GX351_06470 [Peptococcaceae bacterium]|nr:hypothetical protein [Peptococcaceae bacterium]
MDKQHFAKSFGFYNLYLTWDDTEIADDRVEVFYTKEDAEEYLEELRKRKLQ